MSPGQVRRQEEAAGACAARTRARGSAGGKAYLEQVDYWIGEEQRCGKQAQEQRAVAAPLLRIVRKGSGGERQHHYREHQSHLMREHYGRGGGGGTERNAHQHGP